MIRVLIAHGHAIIRCGLLHLCTLADDIEVVGQVGCGSDVIDFLRNGVCDLIMLDLSMPGISGTDLIQRIQAREPRLPVLVLSRNNDSQIARHVLKAGVAGYVTNDVEPEILLAAVRKIVAGGSHIDPDLAAQIVFETAGGLARYPHEKLSSREMSIFRLFVSGKSVNQIADDLCISNKTVSTHKTRMMEKMGFHSNLEMLRYGLDCGLSI